MRPYEQGVIDPSALYFQIPSQKAARLFFYPICIGHFYCDETYDCYRTNYDSYLFLYVVHGSGFLVVDSKSYSIGKGSLAYIDCYKPHRYYTDNGWEILWLHFDGPLARAYYDEITDNRSPVFYSDHSVSIKKSMEKIYTFYTNGKKQIDECIISNITNNILTFLFEKTQQTVDNTKNTNPLKDTLFYISEHIDEALSIDLLASRIYLSKYHFIRLFKKEIGYTPHEYILITRVNAASRDLKSTSDSIKDIAIRSGFTSESSFCTTFKKLVGVTPRNYRLSHSTSDC